MSLRLRDLIRQVRACKTAAEERAVIAKESAMIRTAIREEQEQYRHRNVAKLLFMHMLGYPTHFGQLECLKLIASPHFPEKRIGYLGLMLLLSEEADVLMLATNSLKNDLNADNKFVAGLALCAIGNLATADMSRDLAPEVDKHLTSHSPYLRKKACLAMSRCLTKVPDMVEDFVERVVSLLKDRSHGVLITVVQLMTRMLIECKAIEENGHDDEYEEDGESAWVVVRTAFVQLVPALVKLLRNLLSMGYSPEHDVNGISDPFLQVQILTLLRLVGENDAETSELMNDVLAQVATNTETSKNAGNAILYECVQTIMAVEAEDGLRVLAVNILGRFLLNRDNNIRYVALNTLASCVVGVDTAAVQRHRTTIVDCLKDPDISIRQRALELIYHLVNQENVETLAAELLNYLVVCPREHRRDICTRVLRVVDTYSPDDRWRVDTLITMLTIAGRECDREVQNATIVYISRSSEDLRAYATHKLLKAIRDDDGSQQGLLVVGIWCIGEYADLLLNPYSYTPPSSSGALKEVAEADAADPEEKPVTISFMGLEPAAVVKTVEDVTKRHNCPDSVQQRALTCYAKLSDRLETAADASVHAKLKSLVKKHQGSHSLELQLRSCEYEALINASQDTFSSTLSSAAKEALARMPVVDLKIVQRKQLSATNALGELEENFGQNDGAEEKDASKKESGLLDLEDIFGGGSGGESKSNGADAAATNQQNGEVEKPAAEKSDVDLLSDIFSAPTPSPAMSSIPAAAPSYDPFSQPPQQQQISAPDLFGQQMNMPQQSMPMASNPMTDMFGSQPQQLPQQVMPAAVPEIAAVAPTPTPVAAPEASSNPTVSAFAEDGLEIEFECIKCDPSNLQMSDIVAKFTNTTDDPFYGLNLQCAVPKYVKMEMLPPSSTTVPASGFTGKQITQKIKVTNSMMGTKKLLMKLKIGFTSKGSKKEHMATFSAFPEGY